MDESLAGVGSGGLGLTFRSNEEIAVGEQLRDQTQKPNNIIGELAAHVHSAFTEAEDFKSTFITGRLSACQRQRMGEYDPDRLSEIDKQGGAKTFFNITETKCGAAEGWIMDMLQPIRDKPWALEPTPIPDLSDDEKAQISERIVAEFQGINPALISDSDIRALTIRIRDEAERIQKSRAAEAAMAMELKIEDQFAEGNFRNSFSAFVRDLCTFPLAILKGPVLEYKERLSWDENSQPAITRDPIPCWRNVSPFDFYPAPNMRDINEGYICERIHFDKRQLSACREHPGWKREAIEKVLQDNEIKNAPVDMDIRGEADRAALEGRDLNIQGGTTSLSLKAVEFHGSIKGSMLKDYGVKKIKDPHEYYATKAILIGTEIVYADLEPDPLGRPPYYVTSYEKVAGDLWGRAICEKMRDCQDGTNAALRNMVNNIALASGPQILYNLEAAAGGNEVETLFPWKFHQYYGSKSGGRPPIDFFQPSSNAQELLAVAEFFEQKCDDRTFIPRFAQGNADVPGAGKTASGLSMLMNSAARGIKLVIQEIDEDILRPAVERMYTWNMIYLDDEKIKGDVVVVSKGAIAQLVREQTQILKQDFLARTLNDVDMQIIKLPGRAKILRDIAGELGIDDLIPSDEELSQVAQEPPQPEGPASPPAN